MFRLKKFEIADEVSTMKVGTDAILLSCWADISKTETILDIGCGCGIISLILAQRTESARITAIDVDKSSVEESNRNFKHSPWSDRLEVKYISLQNFGRNMTSHQYDLIISNPPFFDNSLKSPKKSKNLARHTNELQFGDLLSYTSNLLKSSGVFCCIFPCSEGDYIRNLAENYRLYCQRCTTIFTKKNKIPKRYLMAFSKNKCYCVEENLFIQDENGEFTEEYFALVKDFYLFA